MRLRSPILTGGLLCLAAVSVMPASAAPLRGIGFWPTDYSPEFLNRAVQLAVDNADLVFVHYDDPFQSSENRALGFILDEYLDAGRQAGCETYVALEFLEGDRKDLRKPPDWQGSGSPTFANGTWRSACKESVRRAATRHKPTYMNLMVEVNLYKQYHPDDWDAFCSLYGELRSIVKGISPDTKVFCSYLYSALQGEFPIGSPVQWDLLENSPIEQDVLGISTYPELLHSPYSPSRIPGDFFTPLKTKSNLPIFIAETGWYSSDRVKPRSSPAAERDYIERLPQLLSGLDVEALCWINLSDLKPAPALSELEREWPQFFSLGLLEADLTPKPAWEAWRALPEGQKTEASVTATPALGIPLSGFVGIGGTKDVHYDYAADELTWLYDFSKESPGMLSHVWTRIPKEAAGLKLEARSRFASSVVLLLQCEGGGEYEYLLELPQSKDATLTVDWSDFKRKEGSGGGLVLQPEDVTRAMLVDVSAYAGKQGANTIEIKELSIQYGGIERVVL